jgi:hypothetical protein
MMEIGLHQFCGTNPIPQPTSKDPKMSILHDLRQTPRLGLLVGGAAATIGVIYGYDMSNIAGALLFITKEFNLTTSQQELVTTAVVAGEVLGARGGRLARPTGWAGRRAWWAWP